MLNVNYSPLVIYVNRQNHIIMLLQPKNAIYYSQNYSQKMNGKLTYKVKIVINKKKWHIQFAANIFI